MGKSNKRRQPTQFVLRTQIPKGLRINKRKDLIDEACKVIPSFNLIGGGWTAPENYRKVDIWEVEMEKPILFNTRMTQSTIADLKGQTRRLIKLPSWSTGDWKDFETDGKTAEIICKDTGCMAVIKCPYGNVGDVLWCRETWRPKSAWSGSYRGCEIEYKAGGENKILDDVLAVPGKETPWRPSIHMPKEACRTRLKITDIRIERLQDISEEDAKAEGVHFCTPSYRHAGWNDRWISGFCHDCACYDPMTGLRPRCYFRTEGEAPQFRYSSGCNYFELRDDSIPEPYRLKFACYWDELNAANGYGHGWGYNDYVWAISFEKVKL